MRDPGVREYRSEYGSTGVPECRFPLARNAAVFLQLYKRGTFHYYIALYFWAHKKHHHKSEGPRYSSFVENLTAHLKKEVQHFMSKMC